MLLIHRDNFSNCLLRLTYHFVPRNARYIRPVQKITTRSSSFRPVASCPNFMLQYVSYFPLIKRSDSQPIDCRSAGPVSRVRLRKSLGVSSWNLYWSVFALNIIEAYFVYGIWVTSFIRISGRYRAFLGKKSTYGNQIDPNACQGLFKVRLQDRQFWSFLFRRFDLL